MPNIDARNAFDKAALLNDVGRVTMRGQILESLVVRLPAEDWYVRHPEIAYEHIAEDWCVRHPEIADEHIEAPLVVVGLTRTGNARNKRFGHPYSLEELGVTEAGLQEDFAENRALFFEPRNRS